MVQAFVDHTPHYGHFRYVDNTSINRYPALSDIETPLSYFLVVK